MTKTIIPHQDHALTHFDARAVVTAAGQAANEAASRGCFDRYRERRADNTIRRQRVDLALFEAFLLEAGVPVGNLAEDPQAWAGMTWGLVEAFRDWQLQRGYATGSISVRLATVKTFAGQAVKAGALAQSEYAMMRMVAGYRRTDAKRVDDKRKANGQATRVGAKKAEAVSLTTAQIAKLKRHPDTAQGRRDALLMALLLDHGLRVGEVAGLQVTDIDLPAGELHFYRPKVDREQTHKLTPAALRAAKAYFKQDAPIAGPLLRSSRKGGQLEDAGMTERAMTARVAYLGEKLLGISGLSAHDCRHAWATQAARNGTPIDRLQDAGGWASPAMPLRYVESAKIANSGVILAEEGEEEQA